MLKALTGEGILWLMPVCQVAWKFGKTPRDWPNRCDYSDIQERRSQAMHKLQSLPGKVYVYITP